MTDKMCLQPVIACVLTAMPLVASLAGCGGDPDRETGGTASSAVDGMSPAGMALRPPSVPGSASGALASYHGGPVLANVDVSVVYWGSNVTSVATSNMPAFYQALTDSSYLD